MMGAVGYFSRSSINEVTGEKQYVSLSTDQEVALGLQAVPEMSQQFGGIVDHPILSEYVEQVGDKVASATGAKQQVYDYDFHVLADAETINAFALPGGQVFITIGLLKELRTESELAGVLGHEVAHVAARHGAEHLAKQQFSGALVGAVAVGASDPNDPYSAQRNAALAAGVAQMVNMKFGREDELESDALGVRFMDSAGYDPEGMKRLMQVLAKAGGGRSQPEFFSTHPNPENRLERIDVLIREAGGPGGEVGADRYEANVLDVIGGIRRVRGTD